MEVKKLFTSIAIFDCLHLTLHNVTEQEKEIWSFTSDLLPCIVTCIVTPNPFKVKIEAQFLIYHLGKWRWS